MTPAAGNGQSAAGSIESLYPFLYSGTTDVSAVLEQVRQSTVAKADEIIALRQTVLAADGDRLVACAQEMAGRFAAGGQLLAFGNGGSATDAQQLATMFLAPGPVVSGPVVSGPVLPNTVLPNAVLPNAVARPLPALGLATDAAVLTALSNDIGVDVVFARQIAAFGTRRDIAIGLSTSGNSENLLRAFDEASRRGLLTIGIAGYTGGRMAELDSIDYLFVVASASIHRIQEAQTTIYDALWELCQEALRHEALPHDACGEPAGSPGADTPRSQPEDQGSA